MLITSLTHCAFPKIFSEKLENIEEMKVIVTNEGNDYEWEDYGLKLHFPQNALPTGFTELHLEIAVSRASSYKSQDESGVLVSTIYCFSHNLGERKLQKAVTLEMQHCAIADYNTQLCVVQSDGVSPPQKFHVFQGGNFSSMSGYASIELTHFCSFSVYLRWYLASLIQTVKSCAALYYTNKKSTSFQFHLYIVPHLKPILKVCEHIHNFLISYLFISQEITRYVKKSSKWREIGPVSPFEFDRDVIHLKLPQYSISGWTMTPLNSCEVHKCLDFHIQNIYNL